MTGQRIGYKRVSTADQRTDRQLDGQRLDEVFEDKLSGKNTTRPQLYEAVRHSRKGDTFIVHSMDRLARNLDDLRRIVNTLTSGGEIEINGRAIDHKGGVRVEFVQQGLTFSGDDSPMNKLMLNMLGAFAEFERELLRERQREGIALAKAAGVYKGGRPKLDGDQIAELRSRHAAGEKVPALAAAFSVSRQTVYRYLAGPTPGQESPPSA